MVGEVSDIIDICFFYLVVTVMETDTQMLT